MDIISHEENVHEIVERYISKFDYSNKETAIVLAAGHGKRIKSKTSKMLHKIWGKPTVERVSDSCAHGLDNPNNIIVVGIKAHDVINAIGEKENTCFAYQEEQNGTGHAVQVALDVIRKDYEGIVYVLPGDMGLLDEATMDMFKTKFISSGSDMMVLTGLYDGDPENNYYGRIVRVKDKDVTGASSGDKSGKVLAIIEHKDILNLKDDEPLLLNFNGNQFAYSKKELIENNEFNSGVYAFKYNYLRELIDKLSTNNVQNEVYVTDLISIFNSNGLVVDAVNPEDARVLMGFNNKSVLKEMENIARHKIYDRIKDIIEIEDPEDFYIHDDVVKDIQKMDKAGQPLDIKIGKGVYIGEGVKLNYNVNLHRMVRLKGNIVLGKSVTIWENAYLATFPHQKLILEDNVEILWGDSIKGDVIIGKGSRIESSVNMTGSDEHPLRVGKNVTVKGTSYVFGSVIEDDIFIEHSVIIKKHIEKIVKKNGEVQRVRFYLPMPEGIDTITDLK